MRTTLQKLTAVNNNGLDDANISANEQAVLDELFAYDKNNTADGGPTGSAYDNLSFAEKLANLSQEEIDAFVKSKNLNSTQAKKLNDIFDDAEAFVSLRTDKQSSTEKTISDPAEYAGYANLTGR